MANSALAPETVRQVTGDDMESSLTFEQILDMAREKWEVIFFYSHTGFYPDGPATVFPWWQRHLGDRAIHLYDPDDVGVQIAMVTGLLDGSVASLDDGLARLAAIGTKKKTIDRVGRALAPLAASLGKGTVAATPAPKAGRAKRA